MSSPKDFPWSSVYLEIFRAMGESTYNHIFCDVKLFLNTEGQCVVEAPSLSLRDLLKNSYSNIFYKVLSPYNVHGVIFTTSSTQGGASSSYTRPPESSFDASHTSKSPSLPPDQANTQHLSFAGHAGAVSSVSPYPRETLTSSPQGPLTASPLPSSSAAEATVPLSSPEDNCSQQYTPHTTFCPTQETQKPTENTTSKVDTPQNAPSHQKNHRPDSQDIPPYDAASVVPTDIPCAQRTPSPLTQDIPIPQSFPSPGNTVSASDTTVPHTSPPFLQTPQEESSTTFHNLHTSPSFSALPPDKMGAAAHGVTAPTACKNDALHTREEALITEPSHPSIGSPVNQKFTFETFVVGKPNEFAYAAAQRVADSLTPPFNPLFLYGHVGLGKTHLMHAMAHRIQQNDPNRRVVYLSAEKFMYEFIQAIRQKDMVSFKNLFRSVDVLMVDDVQFISGKDSTQEEFFHTFNALVDQDRQVIISADKPPSELAGIEDRIRSRLGRGLAADLHPTTYELRLGILQSKAEQASHSIGMPILEFLARRITSNVRELEGALTRLMVHSNFSGAKLSLDTAKDVLHDLLRSYDRCVTIEDIQKRTAEYYHLRVQDLSSAKRLRPIVRPRQVAMFLCKELTPSSLPDIGRAFGGRDHTTVLHAIQKIQDLMQSDPQWGEDIESLRRSLKHVS